MRASCQDGDGVRVDRRRHHGAGAPRDPRGAARAGRAHRLLAVAAHGQGARCSRRCARARLTKAEAVYRRRSGATRGSAARASPTSAPATTPFDNSPARRLGRRALRLHRRPAHGAWSQAAGRPAPRAGPRDFAAFFGDEARDARRATSKRTGRRSPGPAAARSATSAPGVLTKYGAVAAPLGRQGPLRRDRDRRLLAGLHGRRGARGRTRGPGGPRRASPPTPACACCATRSPSAPPSTSRSPTRCSCAWPVASSTTVRLYRPTPTLAFGRLNALRPGLPEAGHAARDAGFQPIVRLAGGHAAAYHEQSLISEEIVPGGRRDRRPAQPLPRRRRPAGGGARRPRRRAPGR